MCNDMLMRCDKKKIHVCIELVSQKIFLMLPDSTKKQTLAPHYKQTETNSKFSEQIGN